MPTESTGRPRTANTSPPSQSSPSLSWLHNDQAKALRGLVEFVAEVVTDSEASGEPVPEPISERRFSGKFNVRVPESLHRELALTAAEDGVSLNRLVSDRLARS